MAAEELSVALFNETPQATALNTGTPTGFPRVNAYTPKPKAEAGTDADASKATATARKAGGR